jgi:PAS domain S-box-containing protein
VVLPAFFGGLKRAVKSLLSDRGTDLHNLDAWFVPAPTGIIVLDSDLVILRANPKMAEMIGLPLHSILGRSLKDVVPCLADTLKPSFIRVRATGQAELNFSVGGEALRTRRQTPHWSASVVPISHEPGPGGYLGEIAVGLMDGYSFETLQKNEALLAEAELIGQLGSWEHDLVTGEDIWSVNLCRMLSVDPTKTKVSEELFWELLHPDDHEAVRAIIDWGMKDSQGYEYRSRFILPDGREKIFCTYGKPVLGPENRVIKRIGITQDITVRVEAERALRLSEQKYREVVESSNDLICTHDLSGRLLSMNELPARLLGYRPQDLIGRHIPDELQAHDKFAAYMQELKRKGFANGLMALTTKSGERRIWEYRNTLGTDGTNSLVRGMARDITTQFEAKKALRESTARLQALVNSIDDIAFEFDVDGTFLDVWTSDESLLFRPRATLIGRRLSDEMGEDFAVKYRDVFRRVLESGKSEDVEYSLSLKDGEHWFLCRVAPVVLPDGVCKSVCVLARDISHRKKAEQSLALFRTLIDRSNEAIEVVDPVTLRYLDVNYRACSEVGYSRGEMLSMFVYDIDPNLTAEEYAAITEELAHTRTLVKERTHRRKDGSTFPVEVNISLIHVDRDYLVAIVRDISERKRAEMDLRMLSGHLLRTQDQDRREFAREIHDGIGQYISGFSLALGKIRQFLDENNPEHARVVSECKQIIAAASMEVRTISYLMHPPTLEKLGLQSALAQLAKGFAACTGIQTTLRMSANLGRFSPEIELTLFRVTQEALNNVYRHAGSTTSEVRLFRRADRIVLRIADRGKGLMEGFDKYGSQFTLGITGMRERVRNLGGQFSVKSVPNQGCVVTVSIGIR